jgi:AcrR family transcriptional regulator
MAHTLFAAAYMQEQVTMDQPIAERPRLGRPRSQKAQTAVLASALSLLKKTSLRTLTIEEIAREAGVSKATIYRWWDSKIALVIDAFLKTIEQKTPFHGPGKVMTVLRRNVENLATEYRGLNGRIIAQIIVEVRDDPEALEDFYRRFIRVRRSAFHELMERGRKNGEIRTAIPDEVLSDLLYGPIYYRLIVQHGPLDDRFVKDMLHAFQAIIEAS